MDERENNKLLQLLLEEEEGITTELMWLDEDPTLQLDDETVCSALEEADDCEMGDCTESCTEVTAATLCAIAQLNGNNGAYGIPSVRRHQHQHVDSLAQPPRARRGSYRQRQKQEIESLRSEVSTLEYELKFLQANRVSFSSSEVVVCVSAPTIDSALQLTQVPDQQPAPGKEDVDMSLDTPGWKAVARQEYRVLELAERENQVLKQDLKRQLRLAKNVQSSLLQLQPDALAQSYLPREEDVDIDQRTPNSTSDWSSLDEDSNLDTDVFADLLEDSDDEHEMPEMISLGLHFLFVPFSGRTGTADERHVSVVQHSAHQELLYRKGYPMQVGAGSSEWRADNQQSKRRSDNERHERFVYAMEPRTSVHEAFAHDQRSRQRGWWGVFERLPSSFRARTLFRACFYLEQQLLAATSGIAAKSHCVDPYQLLRVGKFPDHALQTLDSTLIHHGTDSSRPQDAVASPSILRSVVAH